MAKAPLRPFRVAKPYVSDDPIHELERRTVNARSPYSKPRLDDYVKVGATCEYCEELPENHVEGKCLFETTQYKPLGKDAAVKLYYDAWHYICYPKRD